MHHQAAKEVCDKKKKKRLISPGLEAEQGNWHALRPPWSRPWAFCALPCSILPKSL